MIDDQVHTYPGAHISYAVAVTSSVRLSLFWATCSFSGHAHYIAGCNLQLYTPRLQALKSDCKLGGWYSKGMPICSAVTHFIAN